MLTSFHGFTVDLFVEGTLMKRHSAGRRFSKNLFEPALLFRRGLRQRCVCYRNPKQNSLKNSQIKLWSFLTGKKVEQRAVHKFESKIVIATLENGFSRSL